MKTQIIISLSLTLLAVVYGKFVGAPTEVDLKDEKLQDVALFATQERNKISNSYYRSTLVDVYSGTKKVVSGMRYNLTFTIQESECTKHDDRDLIDCEINKDGMKEICIAEIWEQAWVPSMKLIGPVTCKQYIEPFDELHLDEFESFRKMYGRQYQPGSDEYKMRYQTFVQNLKRIDLFNKHEQGSAVYKMNHLGDLTVEEFKKYYTSGPMKPKYDPDMKVAEIPEGTPPESYDWRDHGAVTDVKNQGSCGSCWAFSTTGNIEGQWAIVKSKLVSLSEQELVDCDKLDDGCNGGLPSDAYKAIIKLGGLEGETDYPYKGRDNKCAFTPSDVKVYINGSMNISSDETEMVAWLAKNGPISIGINALMMQFYFGGIAHPWKIFCNPNSLDHGVLIVGYGIQNTFFHKNEPYWIIKNSWGRSWGESGYYRVYRGAGVCGLNQMCTSAIVN